MLCSRGASMYNSCIVLYNLKMFTTGPTNAESLFEFEGQSSSNARQRQGREVLTVRLSCVRC